MRPPPAARLRRHLAATLDLTLWCLGCDVRHPDGNLLVARGLARVRPPAGRPGATMYADAPPDAPPDAAAPTFAARGFALFVGDPARGRGLLLRRHDPGGARLTDGPTVGGPLWGPGELPAAGPVVGAADAADAAALLAALAARVADHERWVAARCGPAYRPACAAGQPRHVRRRQRLGTAGLVAAWEAAAAGYAALAAGPGAASVGAAQPGPERLTARR